MVIMGEIIFMIFIYVRLIKIKVFQRIKIIIHVLGGLEYDQKMRKNLILLG